jgi:3'-5' exoribonuclease
MPAKESGVSQKTLHDIADQAAGKRRGNRSPESAGAAVRFCELVEGQEADFYALLADKQEQTTRDGKPYYRVTFRDAKREVSFPIWSDSAYAVDCRDRWSPGTFYKLRASLRLTNYGPQLEIRRIRPVDEGDAKDGFDPLMCQPISRFEPAEMFAELMNLVETRIADAALRQLVIDIYVEHRETLLVLPAARHNHHAFIAGYLEHVLNVARTCCHLADKYAELYVDLDPPLNKDVIVAGAVLHDIGKLRELSAGPAGAEYTPSGVLIGHILQGRDIVRETAAGREINPDTLLRLEHVIVAHQRLPEWGAPKPPMTPEALIVHFADDLDAKLQMMVAAIGEVATGGPLTSKRNPLGVPVYRGMAQ